MSYRSQPFRLLVIALLLLGALTLGACSSTPLPPLFIVVASGDAAPAASEATTASISAPAASAAMTTTAVAEVVVAAPEAAQAVAESAPLTTTMIITASVRSDQALTVTAPITSAVVLTAATEVEPVAVAPTTAPTRAAVVVVQPTATRVAPTATRVVPTATRVAPTATRVPTRPAATRAPARPSATPTSEWPKTLVITAEDIEQGASSVPGLQISGLDVAFGNDTMTMTFDSLRYSFVSMRNVTIEGHFVVNNCDVDFVADRIAPRNLATGAIPGFINQSLDQQLGVWCVESLTVQPGQLAATVRPR